MKCWRRTAGLSPCAEDEVILDVPHCEQKEGWSCGRAAAAMVFKYHVVKGRKPQATPIDGTDPRSLEASLWLAGLSVQAGSMDVDDLRYHTRRGRPVIALVTHSSGVGHYVVVTGVVRGGVYYLDPDGGPDVVRERADDFALNWQDRDRLGVTYVGWGLATC
jgi:ABC-type bacteriocin/lantibiotic exporter with double-glycine peptidase domain